ncbi:MAG: hypothetical protein IKJ89_07505, partial [Kiritimatiellae bacterium]|nr:hypothetical protein [Kiritimatiellia bacterium]
MRIEKLLLATAISLAAVGVAQAATTMTSGEFRIDLRANPRASAGLETLTYSALWDGGDGSTVTIAQNGSTLVQNLSGEGERAWSVSRNGTYTLTHTTYTNGVAGKVETATFVVSGLDEPFAAGDVTVSDYSAPYDGAAHGIGVAVAGAIQNATLRYASAQNGPYSATAPTRINVGSQKVWCEVAAPGYITQTNSATITISKKTLTVTAAAKSKTYGTADPALTYTAQGLVGTDKVTGTLVRDAGENVGTYAIKQGTLTAGDNYAISYTGANLTISKKTLTVTAAAKSKTYGAADP